MDDNDHDYEDVQSIFKKILVTNGDNKKRFYNSKGKERMIRYRMTFIVILEINTYINSYGGWLWW